ncbi:hypothetical protein HHI36_008796, partial [Cryptolaemus montrouzieri]
KAGIYPFATNISSGECFMPSYVTDRPESQSQTKIQELLTPETNRTNTQHQSFGPEITAHSVSAKVEVETSPVAVLGTISYSRAIK